METRAYSWLTGYSGHSSSTIMMSLPSASCTSTVDSRREHVRIAVQVRLEVHALFADLPQAAQAENLKAAGIGQDRARPRHEPMQSAQPLNRLMPGPQIQMIGVAKNNGTPRSSGKIPLREPLTVACVPTGMKIGVGMSPCGGMQDTRRAHALQGIPPRTPSVIARIQIVIQDTRFISREMY